jgi:hypothetical protein
MASTAPPQTVPPRAQTFGSLPPSPSATELPCVPPRPSRPTPAEPRHPNPLPSLSQPQNLRPFPQRRIGQPFPAPPPPRLPPSHRAACRPPHASQCPAAAPRDSDPWSKSSKRPTHQAQAAGLFPRPKVFGLFTARPQGVHAGYATASTGASRKPHPKAHSTSLTTRRAIWPA